LRLIGRPYNKTPLTKKISENQLTGTIEFKEQVLYRDIPDLLHGCDLLIVNRNSDAYSHYGFPTKWGEYLATGKPTLVTNVGNLAEYLEAGKEALFANPDQPESLADAIIKRYKNYHYYENLGARGREKALQLFDHQKHADRLASLMQKVAKPEDDK